MSCKKKSIELSPATKDIEIYELVNNSGKIHNQVLSHILSVRKQSQISRSQRINYYTQTYIDDITTETYEYLNDVYDFGLPNSSLTQNQQYAYDVFLENTNVDALEEASLKADSVIVQISQNNDVSSIEANLLQRAEKIFNNIDPAWSELDGYNYIIAQTTNLLNEYNSYTWVSGNGYAAGGYINILKSSAEFWREQYLNGYFNQISGRVNGFWKSWGIIQFDAAGYIFGWGKAWLWDEKPTASERIKEGISTAGSWSGLSSLK